MFRKAHLLPISSGKFDSSKQHTKADFRVFPWGTLITIRWSKTIQFRERVVEIPLPCIPRSRLCPTTAIIHAFSFTPDSQAFNWVPTPSSDPQIFTYALFLRKPRDHLSLVDIDPTLYAGHSFRRGGRLLLISLAFR